MSALDWLVDWTDVTSALNFVARIIPAGIMFPTVFMVVQALMTVGDVHDLGAAVAIRGTLHGSHLDAEGLAWSLGVAAGMTLWGAVARALHRGL